LVIVGIKKRFWRRTCILNPSFNGAIPGHFVQYGNLAEDRIELLEQKIKAIIEGLYIRVSHRILYLPLLQFMINCNTV